MSRLYVVKVNWPAQFLKSGCFATLSFLGFVCLIAAFADPHLVIKDRVWMFIGGTVAGPLFFYLAVGAWRNGRRALVAIWHNRYGWRG
jgi:hypothetical protein